MLGIGKHAINAVDEVIYTQLLAHFNDLSMPPTDERGGSYTIVDPGQSMTIVDPKFGYRCLDNNGGAGYFTPGPGRTFNTEEGQDWCLECWVRVEPYPTDVATVFCALTDVSSAIYAPSTTQGASLASYNYALYSPNGPSFGLMATNSTIEAAAPVWQHIAVYRVGSDAVLAIDGVVNVFPGYGTGFFINNCARLYIGLGAISAYPNYQGRLDCLRYSTGISRYSLVDFVPPAIPFILD